MHRARMLCRAKRATTKRMGTSRACALAAACALAGISRAVFAGPTVQMGNYVASNLPGSSVVFSAIVTDPAGTADDIEGMNFAIQLGTGVGSTPTITVTLPDAFTTNTVWTGSVAPDGAFGLATTDALFKAYGIITNNGGVAINANGVLARIGVNTAGAATGQMAVKLTGTKDPTVGTVFLNGLGSTVPATFIDGSLTIISNPVVYWNGATNAAWDTTSNWSGSAKPTNAQDAYLGQPIPGSGATITLTAAPETVNNLWLDGSYTFSGGQLNIAGGGVTVFTGSTATLNTIVGGSNGLTLSGGGGLVLGGSTSNTYTGNTTVNAGTLTLNKTGGAVAIAGGTVAVNGASLQFSAANQTGNQTAIVLTNNINAAVMTLASGANQTIGSLAGDGNVVFSNTPGTSLSVGSNGTPTAFSGNFSGAGTLIKTGAGTFTISGTNNSLPAVQVNGGTLTFSNAVQNLNGSSLTGSWTVNAGTLNFPAGATVTTIAPAAVVSLGAPTASFPALSALTTNQGTFTVSGGKTFATAGALTNDSVINVSGASSALTVAGGLSNSGTPGATGSTSVGSGSSLSAKFIRQNSLTVTGNASIAAQASGGGTSVLGSLSLGGTPSTPAGKLDIADTKMVINDATASHATTAANINSLVNSAAHYVPATGKNLWDGNGITSSLLVGGADGLHSVGVADNATLGAFTKTTFGGQNVSSASILVAYTLVGDTNLDGKVDIPDFVNFQNGFGRSGPWQTGDFNHDGNVNYSDFVLFQNGFGRSMPGAGSTFITTEQRAEVAAFAASVPEPASIGLVMFGGLALLVRPRRSLVCERGGE